MSLLALPTELHLGILSWLPFPETQTLLSVAETCSYLHGLSQSFLNHTLVVSPPQRGSKETLTHVDVLLRHPSRRQFVKTLVLVTNPEAHKFCQSDGIVLHAIPATYPAPPRRPRPGHIDNGSEQWVTTNIVDIQRYHATLRTLLPTMTKLQRVHIRSLHISLLLTQLEFDNAVAKHRRLFNILKPYRETIELGERFIKLNDQSPPCILWDLLSLSSSFRSLVIATGFVPEPPIELASRITRLTLTSPVFRPSSALPTPSLHYARFIHRTAASITHLCLTSGQVALTTLLTSTSSLSSLIFFPHLYSLEWPSVPAIQRKLPLINATIFKLKHTMYISFP